MNTVTITVQSIIQENAPVQQVEIPTLHRKGNYAVTRMIANVNDDHVQYLYGQYTVTHIPSGRCCPVWFVNQKKAAQFCNWMAEHFADGDTSEAKRIEKGLPDAVVRMGGNF